MSQIERRLYTRVCYRSPVTILYDDHPLASYYTLNASVGGLLISAKDIGLSPHSLVSIRLLLGFGEIREDILMPAIVKRINSKSIAIGFEILEKAAEGFISHALLDFGNASKRCSKAEVEEQGRLPSQ